MKQKLSMVIILSILITVLCPLLVSAYNDVIPVYEGTYQYWIRIAFLAGPDKFSILIRSDKPLVYNDLEFVAPGFYKCNTAVVGGSYANCQNIINDGYSGWPTTWSYNTSLGTGSRAVGGIYYMGVVDGNYNITGIYKQKAVSLTSLVDYSKSPGGTAVTTVTNQKTSATFNISGLDGWTMQAVLRTKLDNGTYQWYKGIGGFTTIAGDGNITFDYNEVSWVHGVTNWQFNFTRDGFTDWSTNIDVPTNLQTPFAKILLEGSQFVKVPTVSVQKYKYDDAVEIFENGNLLATVIEPTIVKEFYLHSDKVKIGTNIITLKKRDGTVIDEQTFILSPNEEGGITPNDNEVLHDNDLAKGGLDKDGKPIAPTSKNPIDWFFYILDYAGWVITSVTQSITHAVSSVTGFSGLIKIWFGYMPQEYLMVLITAVTVGTLMRILGR